MTLLQYSAWWHVQTAVGAIAAVGFALIALRAVRAGQAFPWRHVGTDRGVVLALGLSVISLGNVVTSYATAVAAPDLRDFGGMLVRGALCSLLAYLWAGELAPRGRVDDA